MNTDRAIIHRSRMIALLQARQSNAMVALRPDPESLKRYSQPAGACSDSRNGSLQFCGDECN